MKRTNRIVESFVGYNRNKLNESYNDDNIITDEEFEDLAKKYITFTNAARAYVEYKFHNQRDVQYSHTEGLKRYKNKNGRMVQTLESNGILTVEDEKYSLSGFISMLFDGNYDLAEESLDIYLNPDNFRNPPSNLFSKMNLKGTYETVFSFSVDDDDREIAQTYRKLLKAIDTYNVTFTIERGSGVSGGWPDVTLTGRKGDIIDFLEKEFGDPEIRNEIDLNFTPSK